MKEVVFLNGKFVDIQEAKISAQSPGLLYGWGLFESMRAYQGKIVYLRQHLHRLSVSCKLLRMDCPYPRAKLKKTVWETVKKNNLNDAYVRLTLWKNDTNTDMMVTARAYQAYAQQKYKTGFRACISQFKQSAGSLLAQIKTTNYLLPQLAYAKARAKGFDEAILLNNYGYIAEASRSNIFMIKERKVFTPSLECGCLNGITRKLVLGLARKNKIQAYESIFTVKDLYLADEAFLTNSLMGVMPLASVGKKVISRPGKRKLTDFFMREYKCMLKK